MSLLANFCKTMVGEVKTEFLHHQVKALDSISFLTYRCTSRCKTCNIWQRKDSQAEELSAVQWETVLDRMANYGIRSFEIFGGDALLRKDAIFDVVRFCHDRGIETYFPTNANLCDRETIEKLVDAGLGTIYLSIDDIAEGHDEVRGGEGSFERVRRALEDFVEVRGARVKPHIVICSTLSNLNFRGFPDLVKFLADYPINAIYPRPLGEFTQQNIDNSQVDGLLPEPYFASSDGQSHLLTPSDLQEMKDLFDDLKKCPDLPYINWRCYYATGDSTFLDGEYPAQPCRMATTVVIVNPNGDVVPCPFFKQYVLGNLLEQNLEDIWGNEKHQRFLTIQQKGEFPLCRNCNTRIYYPSLRETASYYWRRLQERVGLNS